MAAAGVGAQDGPVADGRCVEGIHEAAEARVVAGAHLPGAVQGVYPASAVDACDPSGAVPGGGNGPVLLGALGVPAEVVESGQIRQIGVFGNGQSPLTEVDWSG